MVKINKRHLVILFAVFCIMTITVNATVTDGTIPYTLPNFISGTYFKDNTTVEDPGLARAATKNTIGIRVAKYNSREERVPYISRLYTGLETGKLYKWQYTFSENLVQGVGDIAPTNNNYIAIVSPANLKGHNLDPYLDTTHTFATEQNPYVIQGYTYSIPNDSYRMFYDSNNKTLTCIMILPDGYFAGQEALQMHCYLMVTLGAVTTDIEQNFTVNATDSIPLQVQGDYTAILNQIIDKLEALNGSGLTADQMQEAVDEALKQHDQQQKDELDGALGDAKDQITNVIEGYLPDTHYVEKTIELLTKQVFGYTGTDCKWTLPSATNPMANDAIMWEAQEIDIGAAIDEYLPPSLRSVIGNALIAFMCYAYAYQAIELIYQLFVKPFSGQGD